MVTKTLTSVRNNCAILVICTIAFILRVKGMTYQSLWVDELGAMNESNPAIAWRELFNSLRCCDIQPPLFFIIERICFSVFGFTETVAKCTVVVAGTMGVLGMYSLGKVVLNKRLGLICAALCAVNYSHIYFSQEVRPYVFAFLFATLSFTSFIALLNSPSRKKQVFYVIASLLLLYTHYYGFFVMAAQALILGITWLSDKKDRQSALVLKRFLVCGILIVVCYLPWISFLKDAIHYQSGWIPVPPGNFIEDYFYGYFGNSSFLNPLIWAVIIVYIVNVSLASKTSEILQIKNDPLILSFTMIVCWMVCVFLLPYLWSMLRTPMLQPRYTIVVIPAVILIIGYGIDLFRLRVLKLVFITLFLILSAIQLFFTNKYYSNPTKSQIREATIYITGSNFFNLPVINAKDGWYQQFYLGQYKSAAQVLTGQRNELLDSILTSADTKYHFDGMWISGCQGDKPLEGEDLKKLDSAYLFIKEQRFYDAYAQLFVKRKFANEHFAVVDYLDFVSGRVLHDDKQIAIYGGSIHSKPFVLRKGSYYIYIQGRGTEAAGKFSHLNIFLNQRKIASYFLTSSDDEKRFSFTNTSDSATVISIELDNDFYRPPGEDRNAFIRRIVFEKVK